MNRKVYFLSFLAIFLFACAEKNNLGYIGFEETNINEAIEIDIPAIQEINIIKYVNAPAGLNVRNFPDINSDRIGGLIDLTEVLVIREDGKTFTIDGIDGKWTFIEADSMQGWVFGGFLSVERPQRLTENTWTNVIAYIRNHLNLSYFATRAYNTTLEDFLGILGFSEFTITGRNSFTMVWGNIINSYSIESGLYSLVIRYSPEVSVHTLFSMEI